MAGMRRQAWNAENARQRRQCQGQKKPAYALILGQCRVGNKYSQQDCVEQDTSDRLDQYRDYFRHKYLHPIYLSMIGRFA